MHKSPKTAFGLCNQSDTCGIEHRELTVDTFSGLNWMQYTVRFDFGTFNFWENFKFKTNLSRNRKAKREKPTLCLDKTS